MSESSGSAPCVFTYIHDKSGGHKGHTVRRDVLDTHFYVDMCHKQEELYSTERVLACLRTIMNDEHSSVNGGTMGAVGDNARNQHRENQCAMRADQHMTKAPNSGKQTRAELNGMVLHLFHRGLKIYRCFACAPPKRLLLLCCCIVAVDMEKKPD